MGEPTATDTRIWLVGLFFGGGVSPTGALIESLAVGLVRRGYKIEVLAGKSAYSTGGKSVESRFVGPVHRLYSGPARATGLKGRLITWVSFYLGVVAFIFSRPLPGVVVLTTTPPLLHVAFVLRKLIARSRCKIILWNQDTYPEILKAVGLLQPASLPYRVLDRVERWTVRRVDQVVALDGAMADILKAHGARSVRVIPNWEIDRGYPQPVAPDALDDAVVVARHHYRYVVLYSGNYGWGHDLTPLLSWLQRHTFQRDFYLICVGGGEKWPELVSLAKEIGEQRLYVAPYLPGDRYLQLLHQVDWGLVTLESGCAGMMSPSKIHAYLAAGKPLIYLGPPGSNVDDAIRNYGCGVRIGYDDPAALPNAIAQVLAPETNYEQFSLSALRAARERHTEEAGATAFCELLRTR